MHTIFLTIFYRRAALHLWKQKLGSRATYQELINIFERAGYNSYADVVRNIVCHTESEMDHFNDYAEPLPQPETYPHPKPGPSLSRKLSHRLSSCDEFLQVNPAAAQNIPEG